MKKQTKKQIEEPKVEAKPLPTLEELHAAEDAKEKQRGTLQRKILKIIIKDGKIRAQAFYETIKANPRARVADTDLLTREEILSAIKDVITSH